MTQLQGIDISHYQSGLNLATAGVSFAMMKATEGTTFSDRALETFYAQAAGAGVLRGVYHFYRGDPTGEADFFLDTVGEHVGDAVLALDFEDSDYLHDVAGAKTFLDRVQAETGVKPVIYMSRSFLTGSSWGPVVDAGYGLWLARYNTEPGDVSPWPGMAMWQYTSSGRVSGWSGDVDLDTFYGDAADWAELADPGAVPSPTGRFATYAQVADLTAKVDAIAEYIGLHDPEAPR
jgi:lysozyme